MQKYPIYILWLIKAFLKIKKLNTNLSFQEDYVINVRDKEALLIHKSIHL